MDHTITIATLDDRDRPAVHALLRASGLPLDGFDETHVMAFTAKDGDALVGSAALEVYGAYGLLRSLAVAPSHRGRGLGLRLTRAVLDDARARGLAALYLLTETAAQFFPKVGFVHISRAGVPGVVQTSVEFMSACPASAETFVLSLKRNSR